MSTPPIPGWCDAAPDAAFSDPVDCSKRAHGFERRIRIRNITEYGAGALVGVLFGAGAIKAFAEGEQLIALTLALVVVGTAFVMWSLNKRASNLERHPEEPCLSYLTRQYRRQYEALRAVPLWYIGPLVPGIAAFYLVVTAKVAERTDWTTALEGVAGPASITIAVFVAVAGANLWAARSLKRKLESIEALA